MSRPAAAVDSLAVLPFATDADPNIEYLGQAIPERIINKLAELQSLKVIASTSSFKYKGEVDEQTVGRKLGVRAVLSGRVVRRGDSLSISAELLDVTDQRHLWGDQFLGARVGLAWIRGTNLTDDLGEVAAATHGSGETTAGASRYRQS
ncbi:MAG TPA: hypothetical protein VKF81_16685 [Blastocatellia bacterium]|nr:hypothetical protein [Blastocatellia bacterium]